MVYYNHNNIIDTNEGVAMASITIRNLDDTIMARLRLRAAQHGWSMEQEVREILQQSLLSVVDESGFANVFIGNLPTWRLTSFPFLHAVRYVIRLPDSACAGGCSSSPEHAPHSFSWLPSQVLGVVRQRMM